jgi:microcystin-dependent protein
MGYLTPDSIPADTICRVLLIPNNPEFIANVTGVLETLIFPDNWTPYGLLTPEQSAAALVDMFDQFCFGEGACHVVGEILCYAVSISPDPNWLPCDGRSLDRSAYPDLFTVIGSLYGSVDSTHFNIPDLRGRTIISNGQGFGLTDRFPADNGGEEDHTLVTAELASHSHTNTAHNHTLTPHVHSDLPALPNVTTIGAGAPQPTAVPGVGVTGAASDGIAAASVAIDNTGSDTPHNNMQPWLCMCYFIVALP